jgi:hypothetical protein
MALAGEEHDVSGAGGLDCGDDRFAAFRTGPTKSRRRFLYDLQCGREDFIIDEEALAHMRRLHLPASLIAKLTEHPVKRFRTLATITATVLCGYEA